MYRPVLTSTSPPPALAALSAASLVIPRLVRECRRGGSVLAALAAAILVVPLAAAGPLAAQEDPDDPIARATSALRFRTIGPTIMGGRVSELAVVESDPSTFYVGVASGGVWKTENAGITFTHVFRDESTASVGAVAVAPSNPNVVWVGTGEPNNRQSSPWGNGVYRSTDAGRTWTHLGLENTHHIGRIQVHPRDPDVAYVAAVGHLWGPNPERGVYRTTDGGENWELVLFVDEDTGAVDLAMDMADPKTIFAAMYQRRRRAWGFNGGGPGSGIYRTIDGGDTWTELTDGLPEGDKGRIGLAIYRGDGNLVFALVEADARGPGQGFGQGGGENGVYRSTDRGESWEHISTTNNRPMYYSQIWVDPNDPERVYLGGSVLYRSSDGGNNFTPDAASTVHLDHHTLWINPANSEHLILAGDGGVSVSWDRSDNWYQLRNLPIAQFYEIGVDMQEPYHVCGGLQDNGSWCAPSDTWSNQGIRTRDWYNVGGGDGFFTVMHPANPDIMIAESQGGFIARVNRKTRERVTIRPQVRPTDEEEERTLRWNWNTPILLSSHDDQVVYAGSNILFRSPDLGQSWEEISADLTWNIDRDTLTLMGVAGDQPQMSRNDGQSTYGNLTALAESPHDPAVLYTGSDDGRVHVTRDGGASWTDVTGNIDVPPYTYVTRIVASNGAAGGVFAVLDGHRSADFHPYIFASDDFGASWERITDGLPNTSLNALAQHPTAHNLLFAGSEVGVHFSIDGGAGWHDLGNGLPTVSVDDIVVHPRDNDLVVGTHGLGIWIMDDIAPLAELSSEVMAAAAHLFSMRRALSYNAYFPQGWTPGIYVAPNPPAGARIRYHLGADADSVKLIVRDRDGTTLRELDGGTGAGLNEMIWNLSLVEDGPDGEPMNPGPRVLPGEYSVVLATGADTLETTVEVWLDPRVSMSRSDLEARQAVMMDSYRLSGTVQAIQERLGSIGEQLDRIERQVQSLTEEVPEDLAEEIEAFREALEELEEELGDVTGGAFAWGSMQRSTTPPTADQLWQIDRSWEEVPPLIPRVNEMVTVRLPALYDRVYVEGLRPEAEEPVVAPVRRR
ncbi:MAG: hypothetical protein F4123_01820 [Gemmatimonadetes bacterium]|nr:hypothetical protein [Gemmatimonadota bacterium]MYB97468.1 hypothetical protein [Gemmatimonadota bacterium]MYI45126.1 hypothetical protein [Gemmatimonadota bacterium]